MNVSVVADPTHWERWPEAEALLKPAQDRGGFPTAIEPDEELFAVLDGDDLLACATAWFSLDGNYVEVKLVGGRDYRRWLQLLNDVICGASIAAGAKWMQAWGRRGWQGELRALGWDSFPVDQKTNGYTKNLENLPVL